MPVHTLPAQGDVTIRAYKHCPAHLEDLVELYSSDEFQAKENASLELLRRLAVTFPQFAVTREGAPPHVPLEQLWNVYDTLNVGGQVGAPSILGEELWAQLTSLTAWVEHRRFSSGGPKLGSNLWMEIFQSAENAQWYLQSDEQWALLPYDMYIHYSAHYPTLLALLAALDLFGSNPTLDTSSLGIPDYAAALVVEVWRATATADLFVRLRLRPGYTSELDSAPYLDLGPDCNAAATAAGLPTKSCPLSVLQRLAAENPEWPHTILEWCEACGNIDSDPCVRARYAQAGAAGGDHVYSYWGLIAAGICVGL
ncbi:uncharacterized protein LOC142358244, partial [Convolutriloba macropyga]|uniref:uncharacterized protein LOC142358244 n=1 Tax=Convolutriloba macropyga TaxID=536237 RepID=UPI003F522DE3